MCVVCASMLCNIVQLYYIINIHIVRCAYYMYYITQNLSFFFFFFFFFFLHIMLISTILFNTVSAFIGSIQTLVYKSRMTQGWTINYTFSRHTQ